MADLTVDKPRKFQGPNFGQVIYPMLTNTQLFAGAAVMLDAAGLAVVAAALATQKFAGFAKQYADNRTGSPRGGASGAEQVECETKGKVWLTVTNGSNWARTDVNATLVYATDSDTFTTSAGTNNIIIGKVIHVPESLVAAATTVGEVLVAFEAVAERSI
jgi:hypothetical protein